ncbi:MAG: acetyl-CoA synthetase, partial [Desulfobacula sp.]
MKAFFNEVIRINMMEQALEKEAAAREMFKRLNSVETPEYFNWAGEIFEDLHVDIHPDKKALVWTDLDTLEI